MILGPPKILEVHLMSSYTRSFYPVKREQSLNAQAKLFQLTLDRIARSFVALPSIYEKGETAEYV